MDSLNVDLIEFLRGERGEPMGKHAVASELARLSRMRPELWQQLDFDGWAEAIEAAIACGAVKVTSNGRIYLPVKDKTPQFVQGSLF